MISRVLHDTRPTSDASDVLLGNDEKGLIWKGHELFYVPVSFSIDRKVTFHVIIGLSVVI